MSSVVELATYPGLDERVIVLRAGAVVDAVFVRTERFDVLIDTFDRPETCQAALRLVGRGVRDRPLVVVNSHMDWDHFWGNAAVSDSAIIIAHEKALQRFHHPSTLEVLRRKSADDVRFASVALHPPSVTFADRLHLHGGDLTLELIATPGHTPDHLSIWIPELRTCLAVDAVEAPIPEVWSEDPEDLRSLVASLRLIQGLEAEHVVLAHGQTADPSVVSRNLHYFETLAERVRQVGRMEELHAADAAPDGLKLFDIISAPAALPQDMQRFYERCHRMNLRATVLSCAQNDV